MKLKLFIIILSVASIFSFSYAAYLIKERNALVVVPDDYLQVNVQEVRPKVLEIESLGLKLPIFGAEITDGKWETTKEGVSYLEGTALPGDDGNSVIYGHNFNNLLGNLKNIDVGSNMKIKYNNGDEKEFVVKDTFVVTSDQTHILGPTDDSRLTIYTCTGFLDSKRFVVTAVPK